MKKFDFSKFKVPVIQAPMAGGFNTPELASSVANFGGVGSFGFSFTSAEKIEETLNITKKLTNGYLFLYTMITFAFFLLINYKYLY